MGKEPTMIRISNPSPIQSKMIKYISQDISTISPYGSTTPVETLQHFYGTWHNIISQYEEGEEVSDTQWYTLKGHCEYIMNEEFIDENFRAMTKFKDFFIGELGFSLDKYLTDKPHILL